MPCSLIVSSIVASLLLFSSELRNVPLSTLIRYSSTSPGTSNHSMRLRAPIQPLSQPTEVTTAAHPTFLVQQLDDVAKFARKSCLNEGTLQKIRDYVYLKLNDEQFTLLFYKLKEIRPNIRMPSFKGNIGPHISIIRHDEWKGTPPQKIDEIGNTYRFTSVRIDVIQRNNTRLYVLIVQPSRKLSSVRSQYARGTLPHNHEFHITLAQEQLR